jgi:NNP family nitrate/nitrite transporter-like MFS transporter
MLSDILAKKYGIRGRIWGMWVIQTIEGLFCILMGLVTVGFDGPDEPKYKASPADWPNVQGIYPYGTGEYTINGTLGSVGSCASKMIRSPEQAFYNGVMTDMPMPAGTLMVIKDPRVDCVHNQNTLLTTMICMICFSICVQMAEGLHFGIVPYISRPALGVVSGMVGAGGNAGALISSKFIVGGRNLDQGFINLGMVIIFGSLSMHAIYFPDSGGILLPKGLGYNPQLIKEKAGQKGSDELDFSKSVTVKSEA